jgi:hypothetical protein
MALEKITYFDLKGKKRSIEIKKVSIFSTGLMFKRKSPPLFFTWPKEHGFSIFSIFCKPFTAIWLDKNMKATRIIEVMKWKWNIRGKGKFLLEIPKDRAYL